MKPPPSALASFSEFRISFQLAIVLLMMLVGTTAYELIEQWLIPDVLSWESHLISVLFSSCVATAAAWFVLHRRQELLQQMRAEIAQRQQVEAELRHTQTELETRVQERTLELSAANQALRSEIAEHEKVSTALNESEKKFRRLVAHSFEGIVLTDEQGAITEWNESEAEITGLLRAEVVGEPIWDVIYRLTPLKQRNLALYRPLKEGIQEALHTGQAPWLNRLVERQVERPDGTCCTVDTITYPIRTDKGFLIGRVSRDITERKRSEEERAQAYQFLEQRVQERTQELSTLLEVSNTVASTLELKPLLRVILDQLKAMLDYDGTAIYVLEGDQLKNLDFRGPDIPESLFQRPFSLDEVGAHREVILTQNPIIIDDLRSDTPLACAYRQSVGGQLYAALSYARSWLGVPLIVKDHVIGMLSITHREPGVYTALHSHLALAIGTQVAVAIENARLYERAQRLAALEERQRLARELHDSVSQALYGIELGATTARELVDTPLDSTDLRASLAEPLDYVLSLAEAGLAEMRSLIFELRPESLETEGLVAGLNKMVASLRTRYHLQVQAELCPEPDITVEVKETLYRIAQEALHNTVKHAHARQVNLVLACRGDCVVLSVSDDGQGFDANKSYPGHLGLQSMRERAERSGGQFQVASTPETGTHIRVYVPLTAHTDALRVPSSDRGNR